MNPSNFVFRCIVVTVLSLTRYLYRFSRYVQVNCTSPTLRGGLIEIHGVNLRRSLVQQHKTLQWGAKTWKPNWSHEWDVSLLTLRTRGGGGIYIWNWISSWTWWISSARKMHIITMVFFEPGDVHLGCKIGKKGVFLSLKEYSMILTTSFYGMNQKICINKKSLFPKFHLIPILHFQVIGPLHRHWLEV